MVAGLEVASKLSIYCLRVMSPTCYYYTIPPYERVESLSMPLPSSRLST